MMRMERSYPHLSGGSCAHNLKTATLPWAASPPALGSVVLWSRAVSQDSQPGQTMVQGHRGQRRQRIYLAFSQLTPGPEKLNQPTTARRMGSMLGPSHYTSSGCKSTQQSVGGERGYRPDSALLLPGQRKAGRRDSQEEMREAALQDPAQTSPSQGEVFHTFQSASHPLSLRPRDRPARRACVRSPCPVHAALRSLSRPFLPLHRTSGPYHLSWVRQ
nr:uncharacterized protein LOC121832233 isoform X1 [Peromyscus maniculatus bairdii]